MSARVPRGGAQSRSQDTYLSEGGSARPSLPLSLRLISLPSWPGALFMATIAVAFVFGLPWLASALPTQEGIEEPAARTLAVNSPGSATVTITLEDGWNIADDSINGPDSTSVTLVNAGATFAVTPPRALGPDATLDDVLAEATVALAEDPSSGWVISDPVPITTDANDPGQCITASTTTDLQFTCAVLHGGSYATFEADSPSATWPALQDGVAAMVLSTTFSQGPT
ncbi:hypothetical protein [Demequina flava]|uniref:hypothetical protein n=1 Tax=Demequina flava TaxID=1095025 RepID=UPI00128E80A6|nr:hypothetical protein [Demequina flava]